MAGQSVSQPLNGFDAEIFAEGNNARGKIYIRLLDACELNRICESSLGVAEALRTIQNIFKCGRIQNRRRRVANVFHQESDATRSLLSAFLASLVSGLADARQRRQRPFQHPEHLPNRNLSWRRAEGVAAALPFLAAQYPVVLQFEKNQFKKSAGDLFARRNF